MLPLELALRVDALDPELQRREHYAGLQRALLVVRWPRKGRYRAFLS